MAPTPRQPPSPEAQAAKLRGILESAVTAIITIDDRGLIESINPATERLFGYGPAELAGQNVKVLMPEPYKAEHDGYITNYLGTGVKKIIGIGREVRGRRKDGTTFPLHLSVSQFSADGRRYFTGMIHDLSDRKHVEEALRESERRLAQAQKMEAVGQLTGGIAHDFNNLLLVITGNHELLEQQLDRDDHKVLLKEAQDAAVLGSKLTDQLLTFARRRHMDTQVIQLNDQVVGITDMLRRTLGEHIMLSTALTPGVWPILADPGQFQSAIVNMAVNARDAMNQGDESFANPQARFDGCLEAAANRQATLSWLAFSLACRSTAQRMHSRCCRHHSSWLGSHHQDLAAPLPTNVDVALEEANGRAFLCGRDIPTRG